MYDNIVSTNWTRKIEEVQYIIDCSTTKLIKINWMTHKNKIFRATSTIVEIWNLKNYSMNASEHQRKYEAVWRDRK